MYKITKQFSFEAAHHLKGLPLEHQCSRPHGHSYRVEVELSSEKTDHVGFVVDYGELDLLAAYIKSNFDHKDLNTILEFGEYHHQTSAENLAKHFFIWCRDRWPQTSAVRVSETQKTWAEYRL